MEAPADLALFEAARQAHDARQGSGVPPYVIFHDSTLMAMAAERPRDLDAFARLPGVGAPNSRVMRRRSGGHRGAQEKVSAPPLEEPHKTCHLRKAGDQGERRTGCPGFPLRGCEEIRKDADQHRGPSRRPLRGLLRMKFSSCH